MNLPNLILNVLLLMPIFCFCRKKGASGEESRRGTGNNHMRCTPIQLCSNYFLCGIRITRQTAMCVNCFHKCIKERLARRQASTVPERHTPYATPIPVSLSLIFVRYRNKAEKQ
ncbi:hypothetical protein BKA65DRAFT_274885 [Rhexocercosporidium sp. MPI-PUGE-AT-0058]|nr:hypothetical protein BKA65DRAFT_274885 [Rhexocercosporidium sp. MPI-PUGE-AT-0058]